MSRFHREEFKILEHKTFLNWASMSPAPLSAVKRVREIADAAYEFESGNISGEWSERSSELRSETAKLINAGREEIAVAGSSTTQGIQLAFECVSPSPGDNVVSLNTEFPSSGFETYRWKKKGVGVRVVDCPGGAFSADDFTDVIDEKTKIVLIGSVNWVTGFRADLRRVADVVHSAGAYLVVDAVQHMGAMKLDVRETDADFVAAGGQKWMFSPFGCSVLYVKAGIRDKLNLPFPSLNNTVEPEYGWPAYFADESNDPFRVRRPVDDARRFEYGGWLNHTGMIALTESLKILNGIGADAVASRIEKLESYARDMLHSLGLNIISPENRENRSSILTFGTGNGWKKNLDMVNALHAKGFVASCRGVSGTGGIRLSIHCFNEEADIDRFAGALKKELAA